MQRLLDDAFIILDAEREQMDRCTLTRRQTNTFINFRTYKITDKNQYKSRQKQGQRQIKTKAEAKKYSRRDHVLTPLTYAMQKLIERQIDNNTYIKMDGCKDKHKSKTDKDEDQHRVGGKRT